MLPSWSRQIERRPSGRWYWGLLLVGSLALAGCAQFNPRGEGYREDDMAGSLKQLRSTERSGNAFGFTNKARQIEEDFGYQVQ